MVPVLVSLLSATALAGAPVRNADNHCFAGVETVVFHCALASGKWIDICADAQAAVPTHVQYRFGAKGRIELSAPPVSPSNRAAWTVAETALARGMQRTASFENEGHRYEVFVTEAGPDTQAGLRIEKGGTEVATLRCADQRFVDKLSLLLPDR